MGSTLKEIRKQGHMTQNEAADALGVSLRSYCMYENNVEKENTTKYKYMLKELSDITKIDEDHGILELSDIKEICKKIFDQYSVEFCYLFGSYAKECATESSDVDLLIASKLKGIKFYGLVETLKNALHKNVDAIDLNQLNNNIDLTKEILKDGIKIYG